MVGSGSPLGVIIVCPCYRDGMIVEVDLLSQSVPVRIEDVLNAYQKGDLYCVMQADGTVYRFPIIHVFRVKETVG